MQSGVVKWFSDQKGFGFIAAQGKDFFVHFKDIQCAGFKSLREGDKVMFEPSETPKGPVALNVSISAME